ncbi:GIY-YIG nuclease family protein, partial [Chromobacterium piscinae]
SRPWFLYVLRCADGALYTGVSTDVARRYRQHQAGKGARYTRLNPPVSIEMVVEYPDRSAALRAEHAFKRLSAA